MIRRPPRSTHCISSAASDVYKRQLTAESIRDAALVVTMGCSIEEGCPKPIIAQMQKKLVEWHLEDPKGRTLEEVRKIRDEIEHKIADLPAHLLAP